ncbi:dihydrodipicolinate synthase family protein [Victivallis sp. Marseille-Q1083]|uniref:dihydrodipicolinate synthase family protein n=1 Tax=Victivallis sp. Marseille-Q1083 TaxID=2717288 RepID=UPI00158D1471|nr:dihydrodipicolinate synthase family protein [Victivallis sp. Marseille-Q1083]
MSVIYSAAPTAFRKDLSIDVESFRRMLLANLAAGVKGFFLCGNMGEWSQLRLADREALTECAMATAGGQAEILAGCTANSLQETLLTMKTLARYAPDAYVVMNPLPATSQYCPMDYLLHFLDAADRPVYYYYCPPVTAFRMGVEDFRHLVAHPNLKGIKNSAGDIGIRKELLKLKKEYDFRLFEGHEWGIDDALMAGCDGALCGLAGLAAKPMTRLAAAVDAGNYAEAKQWQLKLLELYHGIYGIDTSTVQNGHKYALWRRGIFDCWYCRNSGPEQLSEIRRREIEICVAQFDALL